MASLIGRVVQLVDWSVRLYIFLFEFGRLWAASNVSRIMTAACNKLPGVVAYLRRMDEGWMKDGFERRVNELIEASVTQRPDHIRQNFWVEPIFEQFEHPSLQIGVSQIIIHEIHQPNVFVNFFDADGLAGKDNAEVNFLADETDATAMGDDNGSWNG